MLINFDSIPAHASREVANIPATGLVFKDYLKISAFEDPKIRGVTIYLSDFDRSITDKLSKDFFDDPSTSSLSCAQTGPVLASDIVAISKDRAGEEVFEESRNLFFKVRRSLIMNIDCVA
jgi:catabolite regulation protein CreA